MRDVRITHVGGPTAILEIAGWRILTDPTFDAPGKRYHFGWGAGSKKLAGPSLSPAELGPIDAVLLSHDHHDDNLDPAGRALLPSAGVVVTTASGEKRLRTKDGLTSVRGLEPWGTTVLEAPGKPSITITATPCRHGPPGSHFIVGDVIGFALAWEGQTDGQLWITGDTVMYDGVREAAARLDVDTVIVHLGGVQFPVSGPLRYTMTGKDMVELLGLLKPKTAIPLHYEGWKHFRQGRDDVEAALAAASPEIQSLIRWLPLGEQVPLEVASPA